MSWDIADYGEAYRSSAPAGATGICTITFDSPKATTLWRIEIISALCASTSASELFIYARTPSSSTPPAAATRSGNLTVGDGTPITVRAPGQLILVWKNVTPGTVAYARVQYLILSGGAGAGVGPVAT